MIYMIENCLILNIKKNPRNKSQAYSIEYSLLPNCKNINTHSRLTKPMYKLHHILYYSNLIIDKIGYSLFQD